MNEEQTAKEHLGRLKKVISSYQTTLIAFSGGVDSALVLKVARDVLGKMHVKAVTAKSDSLAERELESAKQFAFACDAEHLVIETREMENPDYVQNPKNRCYFCKTELYRTLHALLAEHHFQTICNGTNLDDFEDIRPGLSAAHEYGVKSPLVEAGFRKSDVRAVSHLLGLSVWDKPQSPCLASRIPFGEPVTCEKLSQIERGENYLKELGFRQIRLRHFGQKVRLELGTDEFIRVMDADLRNEIVAQVRALGFKTVYFEPYQMGRLNHEAPEKNLLAENPSQKQ